ncbi:transmembrane protein 119b [Antennarius striatus]|uniref:transmembrane protein 119b n=1 Tax=Antennarius striatus TaxID=241820 RepID=UPI0035AF3BF1
MLPMALHLFGLCVLFHFSSSLATPLPLYGSLEGSTDEEEFANFTSFLINSSFSSEPQTTPVGPTHVETGLSQVLNFLEENVFLILVCGFLLLFGFLVICGAIFMSRRRRVNAYYPSSFPSKMYVDHRDKTGEATPFKELPEKPVPEQQHEPVDSHKQLQADIMRAAKSLRTPNKSVDAAQGSSTSHKVADHSPDGSTPDGGVLDQQIVNHPEEKELSETDNDTAAAADSQLNPPEPSHPEEEDDSQGPPTSRSPRPSSLHIHNDSATLQLIAGEKTAF